MPKQFKTYTRFDGGLNTKTNSRSIQDNELAQADNVIVDEFGVVKSCGKFAVNTGGGKDYQAPDVNAIQAGYGLFQTRFDYNKSNSNTSVISTFYANAHTGSKVTVERSDGQGDAFTDETIDLGAPTSTNQGKVIYHIADGIVRVCDTNVANTSTSIKKYGYFQTTDRFRNESGTTQTPGNYNGATGFQDLDTKLSKPTRGVCSIGMRGTTAASGSDTLLISSITDSFPSSVSTELASGVYLAVNQTDAAAGSGGTDAIASRSTDERLVVAASGASFGDDGENYRIYPPDATGFNLDFKITTNSSAPSNTVAAFKAGNYEFASTFLYDGDQESLPYVLGGELTLADNDSITCTVMVTNNSSGTVFPANIKGGRIYIRKKDSDEAFIFFGEVSLINGTKPTLDGQFTHWDLEFGSVAPFAFSSFVSNGLNVDTYESLNGYNQDASFISVGLAGEKYQTSVVTNRRAFIANVRYTNEEGIMKNKGDTIRYSEINKFDTFPEFNFLDIGVNDGEEFIKLEAFADRLLAYKERTLYVINIGGGSDTQWFLESTQNNMGVSFHSAVVKTEIGVCWVNKNGLYIYDGSRITNLQTKIIESDWTSFITSDTMLAYEPTHKHLVVIKSASDSGSDNGDAYIYSFITNSFTKVTSLISDSVKTNPITDLHNNLSIGKGTTQIESYDGEPSDHQTFDIKLKDDDFGLPNTVKKVYGVTVEYSTTEANTNGVKFEYINDSGAKVSSANLGNLSDTNDAVTVDKFNIGSPVLASSFQVQLDLDGNCDHKIHSVGVEYRPLYKRIT
tara:strand:- start:8433 stop:10811 length:2379 start_codon:yes stop_codon:yes gene_type:complete